jgi:hypothetical protein
VTWQATKVNAKGELRTRVPPCDRDGHKKNIFALRRRTPSRFFYDEPSTATTVAVNGDGTSWCLWIVMRPATISIFLLYK